jgi:hypothetical protein
LAHYLFNFTAGDRQQARTLLQEKVWLVARGERHRDALGPGDLALIYMASEAEFIGRVELASAAGERGVSLAWVEEWHPAVPMDAVVQRIDPTASNPHVQANAASGFRGAIALITAAEYEAALALSREADRR